MKLTKLLSYPEDDYFLGRLLEKPYVLDSAGVYGGNHFNKGWWVARMQWYERKHTGEVGNHYYDVPSSK